MNDPRISVLLCVYNGEETLGEAVESILSQTLQDLEFVIIDDGSTDSTPEILEAYAKQDARIRVYRQENKGLTRALNDGIALCKASLIARQDADDRSLPERLAKQVSFMDENPDTVLLGTSANLIGESRTAYSKAIRPTRDEEICRGMQKSNQFFHTSVVFRRDTVQKINGYDTEFRVAQDYELWFRILEEGRAANLAEPLVDLSLAGGGISRSQPRKQVRAALRAKWKNRKGRVLKNAPMHRFWWQLRGFLIPPGTLAALRAKRS